jgi:hypothetical protein
MNLLKISLTQVTYAMGFFSRHSIFINEFLLMFTTILTNELHAAFTLVDAGKFSVWIKHQVHQVELCLAQLAFRGFVAFVD